MPNRVIKESIKRSPQIDALTWFEEVVFYRLMVTADDYGCMDARPILLKNELFPTKENITKKSIEDAIRKLVSVGLLYKYEANGMPYVFFPTWEKHQRIRNKHRKYPHPPDDIGLTANCCQMTADCLPESESNPIRIQSESESESEHAQASAQVNAQDAFAQFWNAYPNHKDKKRAESAFANAIRKVDLETMLAAIDAQKRTDGWIKENGRFIPMPSTWLNGERWNDDAKPSQKAYWRTGRFAQTRPEQPYEKDDLEMAERLFAGKEQQ